MARLPPRLFRRLRNYSARRRKNIRRRNHENIYPSLRAAKRGQERGHSTQQFEGVLIASAVIGVQIGGKPALMAPRRT
jgi:hypothetical protein